MSLKCSCGNVKKRSGSKSSNPRRMMTAAISRKMQLKARRGGLDSPSSQMSFCAQLFLLNFKLAKTRGIFRL